MDPAQNPTLERRDPHTLSIYVGPYLVADEPPFAGKFERLSERFTGDVFAVVDRKEWRHVRLGRFELVCLNLPKRIRYMNHLRNLIFTAYLLALTTVRHYRRRRYDLVIANNPLSCGLLALAVSRLTGAKLVVEVNGDYAYAFRFDQEQATFGSRWRHRVAQVLVPFVLRHADGVKLLYKGQIAWSDGVRPAAAFANYVPTNLFHPTSTDGKPKYILFIGFPWYLKGVDVLIRAFQQIAPDFPDYSLKIVGHCPNRRPFEELAGGNRRIEFGPGVWYKDVVALIENCSLFVLPSRTEAMGRVLLEAMAARKPVIGSRVGGIPSIIDHGQNGLLFEPESVEDLARQMRRILSDPVLADRLAESGYGRATSQYTETQYVENYRKLADRLLARPA